MSGQRQAANFRGAAVQHVKQHALALFNPHRLAVPQHTAIDGEIAVAHFVAVRHAFRE